MKSILRLLFSVAILTGTAFSSFSQDMWTPSSRAGIDQLMRSASAAFPTEGQFDLLELNVQELKRRIGSARQTINAEGQSTSRFELDLPIIGGGFKKAVAEESSILTPALRQLLPELKTYVVYDAATRGSLGRITIHADGITALLFTTEGTQYLHPITKDGNTHASYLTRSIVVPAEVKCALNTDEIATEQGRGGTAARGNAGDGRLRTYRLAVAATGEYVEWAGNSQAAALAAIAICVNSVNAIYERDAAIRFTLVSTTDLMFTDPDTDPYGSALDGALLTLNDNIIDGILGSGNYDIGVLFSYDWNGGLAQLNSVCTANKGRSGAGLTFGAGANPTPGPQGPVFDGTVAHEIAHQFSATHTMAASNGGCAGNTTPSSAWEPGGGSTIMAYAGVCTGNSFQNNSDLYFHAGNVAQIANYAVNLAGNSCPVLGAANNNLPDVTVTATSFTIPISTPFFLTAIGTDADAHSLSYTWEQLDAGIVTGLAPQATATSGPNFRSYPPGEQPIRYFPNLPSLVSGTATPYEVLPSVSRNMNFRVNVRDNAIGGGGNVYEDVLVSTDAAGGPFTVTSQNAPVSLTANGSNTMTITWNVANTTAAPFNTSLVDIYFSADGGANFNYPLLMGTANDGTQVITVPNIPTASGRIMIRAVGNIFFNVNAANISITSSCTAEGAVLTPESNVTSTPGSAALNLAIAPNFGTALFPTVGASLTSGDPSSTLGVYYTVTGGCINFSNIFTYDVYPFQVNVSGNYTFQKTAGTYVMNVYQGEFSPDNACASFVGSNGVYNGTVVNISNTLTVTLVAGVRYTLAVGSFSASAPVLPFNYTISLSFVPAGGNVFSGFPNPGVGFSYKYVVVDNNTGNIVEILNTPDLTNSSIYNGGIYSVYGLSYATGSFSDTDLDAYEGGAFTALALDLANDPVGSCGNLSKNRITVNVFDLLPVELLPLTATVENRTNRLRWGTLMEQALDRFDIEKSADGRLFTLEAKVMALGESNTRKDYNWLDLNPLSPGTYYRIKAVNLDGSAAYTNVVYVKSGLKSGLNAAIFPNPVHSESVIQVQTGSPSKVKMDIYNSAGMLINTQQWNLQPGTNTRALDLKTNQPGIYWVVIADGTETIRLKVLKAL